MIFFSYLIILTIAVHFLNKFCLKKSYLISETGDNHQKFASQIKIPLTGGIFFYTSILFFYNDLNFLLLIFSLLILLLGIVSDLKLIKSANKRLLIQIIIVFSYIYLSDLYISNTRIDFLDNILTIKYFNYLFVMFCILILINGSNFFDGLNTLNIGYYFFVILVINILILNNQIIVENSQTYNYFILIFMFLYILNFTNKIYLGDSGSYLLGFIFSVLLINLYMTNNLISPFYIILLVWYPCYENLFSIIRKRILNRSTMKPDSNHLHQLIFYYIKKEFSLKTIHANLLSANVINIFNFSIFLVCSNFISYTKTIIFFIMLNLVIYTVIYYILFSYRYKKL